VSAGPANNPASPSHQVPCSRLSTPKVKPELSRDRGLGTPGKPIEMQDVGHKVSALASIQQEEATSRPVVYDDHHINLLTLF
jgi:hypothetical protein